MVHSDGVVGGPDRDRTDDLFHAMEARSQLRHRPTPFYFEGCQGLRQTIETLATTADNGGAPLFCCALEHLRGAAVSKYVE